MKIKETEVWDRQDYLSMWEEDREEMRKTRRLSFDCYCLRLKGGVLYCSAGMKVVSLSILEALQGEISRACQTCKRYED